MKGCKTIREAAAIKGGFCPAWWRAAVRLGKIKADRAGRVIIIPDEEVKRALAGGITISRQEMAGS